MTAEDKKAAASARTASVEEAQAPHFSTQHLLGDLKGRAISSGLVTGVSQAVQFVMTLVSTMVLARLLLPRDYGLVTMVITVLTFLRAFKEAGLSIATVQREGITHAQVSNLFWINIAVTGTITIAVGASAPLIAWFYGEPRLAAVTRYLALGFVVEGSTVQHMALLNRQMRFKTIASIQIAALAGSVATGIIMACSGCGYWSLVGYQLAAPVVLCVRTWSASRWRPQWFTPRSGTRPLLDFGAKLTASWLVWSFARASDCLLIGRFYGAEAVGLYSRAGALLSRPLEQVLGPTSTVFVPVLSRLQVQPERYRRTFLQLFEAMALMTFLSTGMFFGLAKPLTLVVLGPKWEKAAVIFACMVIGALWYPFYSVCTWLYNSQGRGGDSLRGSTMASILTICSIVAGLHWGPVGVAVSYSFTGLLIILPITSHIAGRTGPVSTRDIGTAFLRLMPLWGVVATATFAVQHLLAGWWPLNQLLIGVPCGLAVGGLFIFLYPPTRRVALSLIDIAQTMLKRRAAALPQK